MLPQILCESGLVFFVEGFPSFSIHRIQKYTERCGGEQVIRSSPLLRSRRGVGGEVKQDNIQNKTQIPPTQNVMFPIHLPTSLPFSMNPRILFSLCTILFALSLLTYRELRLQPDGRLHVHFLDVGQGDATLLITPSGKQILVDGGPNMETLEDLGRLMPFFDRSIDLLILTHPNVDHFMSFPEVLRRYDVRHILLAGSEYRSSKYEELLQELLAQNVAVTFSNPQKDIVMGDGVVVDVVWPGPRDIGKFGSNDESVTVRILYAEHSILLSGDIEKEAEEAILHTGENLRSTVLKIPHHGSRSSSSTGFILAVQPSLGIISAGRENKFGHPHEEIVERYGHFDVPLRSTVGEGMISLVFE